VRAWREVGNELVLMGREDEGIEAVRRALELDPEDPGALASMGRALFVGLGRFGEAVPYLERALARKPEGGWYALQLAHCLALVRDFPRGEAAAVRAIELQEASLSGQEGVKIVGGYMRLAHLLALQGRHEAAVTQLEKERAFLQHAEHALRNRSIVEVYMRLGASQQALGRRDAAQASLAAALGAFEARVRVGADEPFTRYYAAAALALRGDKDAALDGLARAVERRGQLTRARARIEPEWESVRSSERFQKLVGYAPGNEVR
jgi:tetratricopeptide (TPR) repeat protein